MRSEPFLAAAMLLASVPLGMRVDTLVHPYQLKPIPAGLVPGDRISAWLSGRKFRADAVWIDLLQYCADRSFTLERGAKVPRLAERIVSLDPGFIKVYMYAGSMLMWQCNRPGEAAALLERGIAANPAELRLKYYLAAFTYSRLNDLQGETALLERLAFAADAPIILRRILANAYEKQRAISRAAAIWRLVYLTSQDAGERRWAERKMSRYGIPPVNSEGKSQ